MMTNRKIYPGPQAGARLWGECSVGRLTWVLTVLFVPILCTGVRAQKVTVGQFFNQENTNSEYFSPTSRSYRAPWLDNTEIRSETRDFDFGQQRYTLRLSPSTPGIARAQNALFKTRENRPDFVGQDLACEALRQRHEDWLDLYLISEELALLAALDSVLADRGTVLNRQSSSLDFDWRDVLALKKEQTEVALRSKTLEERRKLIISPYGLEDTTFDFSSFPTISELPLENAEGAIPEDPETTYKLALAARELELEQAESRQYLDFIQAEYQGPHANPFAERFSIGVGFQIPGNGNSNLKIRELELEQEDLRRKQATDRSADQEQYDRRLENIVSARVVHEEMARLFTEEAVEMAQISTNLARRQGFNPLPLLDIKTRALKNKLRLLNSTQEVLEGYLELRENQLCAQPVEILWQR